jgi:hypothetical protein
MHWNLGAFLVLLESPWWVKFNRVYFTIFRAKVWKILIFEWILLLKIQRKLQKLGLEGKISWALNLFTLGPTVAQATLIYICFCRRFACIHFTPSSTVASIDSLFSFTKFCSLNFYFLFLKRSTYNQHTTYIISVKAGKVLPGIA